MSTNITVDEKEYIESCQISQDDCFYTDTRYTRFSFDKLFNEDNIIAYRGVIYPSSNDKNEFEVYERINFMKTYLNPYYGYFYRNVTSTNIAIGLS